MASEAAPGLTIPDHILLRKVGGGSYGEIWLAKCALGHYRAVKLVHRSKFSHPKPFEREFSGIQKYEPVSREHEGLVDVLQVGRDHDGAFFYYVMELADDVLPLPDQADDISESTSRGTSRRRPLQLETYTPHTLARDITERGPLPIEEVISTGVLLAEALEYLHGKGLLHRDIKPSNIVFVGGRPKLADAGTIAGQDDSLSFVGTLGFMPPEGPGTVQADIYSLGKVLYEAATGNDRQDFPALPADLGAREGKEALLELNEVILKACAPNPQQRYRSASEMVQDLKALQAGRSLVQARARRRYVARAKVTVGLLLGLAAILSLSWSISRSRILANESSTILLPDGFNEPVLDTNRWTMSKHIWPPNAYPEHPGKHTCRAVFTNAEVILEATAQHDGGYTTAAGAWLDTVPDLRKYGECRIEITLAGGTCLGVCEVMMCDKEEPPGPKCIQSPTSLLNLWAGERSSKQFLPLLHTHIAIVLLPDYQAAIVYPDAGKTSNYRIVDLSSLAEWRLRFFAMAASSAGAGSTSAKLQIKRVTLRSEPPSKTVVGFAYQAPAGTPVGGATVLDERGRQVATTLDNGAFKFNAKVWPARIRVENTGYDQSSLVQISGDPVMRARHGPVRIRVWKSNFGLGDAVEVIRPTNSPLQAIACIGTNLWIESWEIPWTNGLAFLNRVNLETKQLEPAAWRFPVGDHAFSSITECRGRLLATFVHPGRIYVLDPNSSESTLLGEPKAGDGRHIDWPVGCAFDGEYLWIVENDTYNTNWWLHALDPESLEAKLSLRSQDKGLAGLAWDQQKKQLWLCSATGRGKVFSVDPELAQRERQLAPAIQRTFAGNYSSLAFAGGTLWAFDAQRNQICRLKIAE